MNKNKIKKLLKNLCCNHCQNDFEENSINILQEEKNVVVFELKCINCGKDFGISMLSFDDKKINTDEVFELEEYPNPITSNEVIDAHKFIKKLDKDWNKYIPKDLR